MNESLLPSRYAKALYKLALEKNLESNVYVAMGNINRVMEGPDGQDFRRTIANPFLSAVEKRGLIDTAANINDSQDIQTFHLVNDFITLLFKNNRIAELREIAISYGDLYRKEKKISRVHVTWAAQPTEQNELRLKDIIESRLADGSSMEYESSTNPSLIGGFIIDIDNEKLDASVDNELRRLSQKLLSK